MLKKIKENLYGYLINTLLLKREFILWVTHVFKKTIFMSFHKWKNVKTSLRPSLKNCLFEIVPLGFTDPGGRDKDFFFQIRSLLDLNWKKNNTIIKYSTRYWFYFLKCLKGLWIDLNYCILWKISFIWRWRTS